MFILLLICVSTNGLLFRSRAKTTKLTTVATILNETQTQECRRQMTLQQMKDILKQHPCAFENNIEIYLLRTRRDVDPNKIDIKAIHATVNDHRTMINYLINNSVNTTMLGDAILDHHKKTGPILSSWRDIFHLLFIIIFVGFILYFFICRTGLFPQRYCISTFSSCFVSEVKNELQQQREQLQQQQQQVQQLVKQLIEQQKIIKTKPIRRRRQDQQSIRSNSNETVQYNEGYMSN
ncbi:unnamed protein product [Rotaria sordida]|uniref:Uncharacterized protein n=1 Tax=Rotaria sordida TaxID=392033 RepID=A0A815NIQ7_9BILA|nr:unnamed protein product [Rotaria sordida]CAF1435160.1 unnamed protein product [Rotaria sordida]CAF1495226.1 unnamed protein product [Rotaria sordida]CAF4108477.1 unnamed protein product [Rotaria sordida]CAF4188030.1 unnamed protein product [Rotaria sordida]